MAHGPGPPQRPQMPAGPSVVLCVWVPTANTLSERDVRVDPHLGHRTAASAEIDFTRRSNAVRHF
jgi:hypothetical protein